MARSKVRIMNADVVDGGTIDLDQEDVRLADGTRLTEDLADEFAEEVLRGVGRPSLSAPGRRSPQLRLAIPEQTRDQLKARAAAEHRSVSEIAREALDRYLAS